MATGYRGEGGRGDFHWGRALGLMVGGCGQHGTEMFLHMPHGTLVILQGNLTDGAVGRAINHNFLSRVRLLSARGAPPGL